MSQGILQPDMWGAKPSDRWDWDGLRRDISQHGVRNSLLVRQCSQRAVLVSLQCHGTPGCCL